MNITGRPRLQKLSKYRRTGTIARILADLLLSNIGFFLGTLTTVAIWVFTWPVTAQEFFHRMFLEVWLTNAPMLTLCCLVSYVLTGQYRYGLQARDIPYAARIAGTVVAVGAACLLFLLWVFLTEAFVPRSTMIAGWFFILVLMLGMRISTAAFFRRYHLESMESPDSGVKRTARKLTVLSHQDGWMPPEKMPGTAVWPSLEEDEIAAAITVLQSGRINQWTGKEVERFQDAFGTACDVRHAIALANGTAALELAVRACGIGLGDEVIVPSRTFIASASSVVLQGATPVFADVDRESQNLSAASLRAVLSPRTKAVIAVHLAGWPCDMEAIMECAAERGLLVIEDCAQAHGARYRDRPVGSFGHAAAFSFCQDKIMTTGGEGGMLLTNDGALWERAWSFKDHGKSYDAVFRREHKQGFRWVHESFGTNQRMTEMQAAIGRQQLKKLPEWVRLRRRNADILTERFSRIDALRIALPGQEAYHSYYKYYVFVEPQGLKEDWNRDRIMHEIMEQGVPCFSGSCSEIYLEKAFADKGLQPAERLPTARELGETSLMFLVHPTLSRDDMTAVAGAVEGVMARAAR